MNPDALLKTAMQQIAVASSKFETSEISRLNILAQRVAEIQRTQEKLLDELRVLAAELDRPSAQANAPDPIAPPSTRATFNVTSPGPKISNGEPYLLGPLAIEIDWAAVGMSFPKQTICERKASDTLRVLLESILARFGDATLEKLAILRVNRAPPLSRRPEVDFLNRKRGVTYQHQRVGRSEWHVLTHSATSEKIDFVHQLAHALRFPQGAMTAREIDVHHEIERLLA